ncbi:MAG: alpha/beta fold hydrolase [Gemmatimonadaceae bacterium]|nr:alpha/beta fold hydrolase [Gemmatimonadaceae bacterium]
MSPSLLLVVLLATACVSPDVDARAAEDVLGTWNGTAVFRGQPLPVSLRFERVNGLLRGTFSAPDIALLDQPLIDVAHDSSRVYFTIDDGDGALVFRGRQTGDTLAGSATLSSIVAAREGASTMSWRVVRSGAVTAPAPYATREVKIAAQGAMLAATLFIPRNSRGRAPAVLLLQGSSTNLRSDYRFYADRFARAGFVVLAFDKRGNGESTGDYRRASYDDLVFDAREAFDTLAAQPEVDGRRVGLWGLSQGAFLAPRVAEHLAVPPAFVVAVSSPGMPISESAAHQDSLRVAWRGFGEAAAARAAATNRALGEALRVHRSAGDVSALLAGVATEPWRTHTSIPVNAPTADELRGWYWYGRTLDPVEWWRRLRVPVLLVYGESDELVPARESAVRLERALRAAGHPDVTVRIYPGANHVIKLVASPLAPAGTSWSWPVLAPGYLNGVVEWMRSRSALKDRD